MPLFRPRPLASNTIPKHREYTAVGVIRDKEVTLQSDIVEAVFCGIKLLDFINGPQQFLFCFFLNKSNLFSFIVTFEKYYFGTNLCFTEQKKM